MSKEAGTEPARNLVMKTPGTSKVGPRNVLKPAKDKDVLMGVQRERR